ncbi:MAG: hypothetical protein BWX98_02598 [Candidatus Aminicenantes bacterium ADurb.Bin147]|nr:MAG: hypothetical protein BWX98_02598 [Candidatus Aminicenantes bacterium ADurb.Bin147]
MAAGWVFPFWGIQRQTSSTMVRSWTVLSIFVIRRREAIIRASLAAGRSSP